MLIVIIGFFSLAALLGIFLLSYVLQDKNTPKGIAILHGFFAAVSIVLLIIYCFFHAPRPIESLVLFILAASGGFILIFRDLMGKSVPKWLALTHGSIAVLGFIFLLVHSLT